ncbi:hypothetical protein GUJ93_ZPchr0011g28125 [Zizania palustris]|uniref:Uncharacterized protein n=1 Tax=Zizania palustris TaxID=103762 RepID=A0A8J6BRY9_ZIZPA|nr:hypothetical protein GUJ93_ZPchr0011g28125 [Zizania palustris]
MAGVMAALILRKVHDGGGLEWLGFHWRWIGGNFPLGKTELTYWVLKVEIVGANMGGNRRQQLGPRNQREKRENMGTRGTKRVAEKWTPLVSEGKKTGQASLGRVKGGNDPLEFKWVLSYLINSEMMFVFIYLVEKILKILQKFLE